MKTTHLLAAASVLALLGSGAAHAQISGVQADYMKQAVVNQTSDGNATSSLYNAVTIDQVGATKAVATVTQTGSGDSLTATQTGTGNQLTATQGPAVTVITTGVTSLATGTVTQAGTSGTVTLDQEGYNKAAITQDAATSHATSYLQQVGGQNTATVHQASGADYSGITQNTSILSTATVYQAGSYGYSLIGQATEIDSKGHGTGLPLLGGVDHATVSQTGDYQGSTITQYDNGVANVTQVAGGEIGSGSVIHQTSASTANVTQTGDGDISEISQAGDSTGASIGTTTVFQSGLYDAAYVTQSYAPGVGDIGNVASIHQTTTSAFGQITQAGAYNHATIRQ